MYGLNLEEAGASRGSRTSPRSSGTRHKPGSDLLTTVALRPVSMMMIPPEAIPPINVNVKGLRCARLRHNTRIDHHYNRQDVLFTLSAHLPLIVLQALHGSRSHPFSSAARSTKKTAPCSTVPWSLSSRGRRHEYLWQPPKHHSPHTPHRP